MRSRTIPAIDDLPVWAIGCFQIRPGYRRRGIAKALLNAVVEAARAAGAPGVEAHPIDSEGRRVEVGAGFVGIASMRTRRASVASSYDQGLLSIDDPDRAAVRFMLLVQGSIPFHHGIGATRRAEINESSSPAFAPSCTATHTHPRGGTWPQMNNSRRSWVSTVPSA